MSLKVSFCTPKRRLNCLLGSVCAIVSFIIRTLNNCYVLIFLIFTGFANPTGKLICKRSIVNVYDLSGNQIMQVQGKNIDFREDGKLVIHSSDRRTVNICNLPNN